MKLLTLDVASNVGWAVWDLQRSEQAIKAGCFRVEACAKGTKGNIVRLVKRRSLYEQAPALFREHEPDALLIESPLPNVKRFKKKGAKTLFSDASASAAESGEAGMDPAGAFLLHQLFTVVYTLGMAFCKGNVFEVPSQTWQTILKPYAYAGGTKERSIEGCHARKIELPTAAWAKHNAADAAMMAVWAKLNLKELRSECPTQSQSRSMEKAA